MTSARLIWMTILPPPYDGSDGRLVILRAKEGDTPQSMGVRAGMMAFPDIPVFTLSIMGSNIPEGVLFPDTMIDTPLSGLMVEDAKRLFTEQMTPTKPN